LGRLHVTRWANTQFARHGEQNAAHQRDRVISILLIAPSILAILVFVYGLLAHRILFLHQVGFALADFTLVGWRRHRHHPAALVARSL